ncbi:hypothetical protein ACIGXM_17755 [Kitasatospora sp. NPDC052896]|uniref:DUF7927 domain-containing protein n=1 Tax=Kitasatospora sp. NPDC052896 TaxID=3364061 RepID=UPI0037C770B4
MKSADRTSYVAGQRITFTVRLHNDGNEPITGAVVTDDLRGDLADARYDQDARVGVGRLRYDAPVLTWTGDLRPGEQTVIVYSVTTNRPDNGPMTLHNAVTGPPFSSCPTGTEAGCSVDICGSPGSPSPSPSSKPSPSPSPSSKPSPSPSPSSKPSPSPSPSSKPSPSSTPAKPTRPTWPSHPTPPAQPTPTAPGQLAQTGADDGPGLLGTVSVLLVIAGATLFLLSRRAGRR